MRKKTLLKRLQLLKTFITNLIEKLVDKSVIVLEKRYVPALFDMQDQIHLKEEQMSRLSCVLIDLTVEKISYLCTKSRKI